MGVASQWSIRRVYGNSVVPRHPDHVVQMDFARKQLEKYGWSEGIQSD